MGGVSFSKNDPEYVNQFGIIWVYDGYFPSNIRALDKREYLVKIKIIFINSA